MIHPVQRARIASGACLFFFVLAAGPALAQRAESAVAEKITPVLSDDIASSIKKEGLENSKVMEHLDYLTNTIGHRLTGSDNCALAVTWALDQFKAWGLDARVEKGGEWPESWNRGQWGGRVVSPIQMELQVATEAWTAGTKGRVRGPLLVLPRSAASVEELGERLRGAWVMAGRQPIMLQMWQPGRALRAAFRYDIAGVVFESQGDRSYPNRMRVFGNRGLRIPKVPYIVVRRDQYRELVTLVKKTEGENAGDEKTGDEKTGDEKAGDEKTGNEKAGDRNGAAQGSVVIAEFDIRNRSRKEKVPLYNVIAEIKGTEKPEEYVVVGGHLDSWHQATGTTDNGTGAATTLEAARILAAVGAKPKRTIRFCLWTGEEQGLLGSRGHVTRHRQEMDRVSAYLNHDTGTNWCHSVRVTAAMYDDMLRVMAPVMTMAAPDKDHKGPVFQVLKAPGGLGGAAEGSDHASFLVAGVPAWSWGLKGRADYFHYSWHSQWDTYDVAIPEYQRHTATVIALAALGIADLPNLLSREGLRAGGGRTRRGRGQARPILEGYLGIELEQGSLVIHAISKDSLAAKSGLEPGDQIVGFNGKDVESPREVVRTWRGVDPPWTLTVKRGAKQLKIELAR